ncbi:RpiB/LacA/LacB family sugar-phosphate isomerase [Lactococcus taiwanensis]|uniref:RpiB/LacA/LacB family sugar-phosphate isomerase n=1 Tax=Lactococcus taiwanensis TaxID=1151742 RepID=A0AA45KHD3_9LACT|nr:RpiB/LacA/LacB family sugar-phosphate isomerase [Lactococcus taiwanensis]QSE77071.1 RpiB/LacA/LacB family sugar-phosphate isomerase [Lactococcus taiwanensis]
MKIAVIQASTQIGRNEVLFEETKRATAHLNAEVLNFGVSENEEKFSYVQIALCVGLLLNSGAVDFVVTGCSSGNGMNIAANALPNVISGYLPTPTDAYLFGRINQGNCASLPLGLNFGWAGEVNLRFTLEKLFEEPMNVGYPKESAERKQADALKLKEIKELAQTDMISVLTGLSLEFIQPILEKSDLLDYIFKYGTNPELIALLKAFKNY